MTGPGIDDPEMMPERDPAVPHITKPEEAVRGPNDPPVVTLQLGRTLRQNNLVPSEELPHHIKVGATNLNNVPLASALQAIMADSDITVLWKSEELQSRTVTLMNLKGPLPTVVNRLCRAAHAICAYRSGALEIMEQETFVVELPPVATGTGAAASNTMADAIATLVGGPVKKDEAGGNLIYTANADGHERVQSYLDQLRNGRPLVILQLYIWEVSLNDNRQLGINWSAIKFAKIGGLSTSLLSNSVSQLTPVPDAQSISLGAVLSGPVDATTLAKALSTQGKLQNISSPQLTFVSGTSAKFEIGGKQRFISSVGTLLSSTVAGSTGTTGVSNNTVSTEELATGLSIEASGSYADGVVFANLSLKTTDLVGITPVPTSGTTLQLPETSDRTVQTVLRVRPGDSLVLAGLQTSRDERSREGLLTPPEIGGMVPLFSGNKIKNTELVVLVKPSVVFFSDKGSTDLQSVEETKAAAEKAATLEPDRIKKKEPPAAVVISTENASPAAAPALPVTAVTSDKPVKPNELQGEFGTVVKLLEDTQAPTKTVAENPITNPVATPETVPETAAPMPQETPPEMAAPAPDEAAP